MATKVLVVGSIDGQLLKAFQKISKLHQKNNFSFAIAAGDIFGENPSEEVDALLNGSIVVPLPTYFTIGSRSLPEAVKAKLELDESGEVCPNLFYQGRKATLKTSEAIKIVFLGGRQVQSEEALTQSIGKYDPLFLENEARSLQGAHDAHILVTNQWPRGVEYNSQISIPESVNISDATQPISNLCATLKPRYHFSSSPSAAWRREPFTWPTDYSSEDSDTRVTRFESLSSISTPTKDWLSAFTLDITKPPTTDNAQRIAPFAFIAPDKRKHDDDHHRNGHRYQDPDRPHNSHSHSHRAKRSKHNRPAFDPNDCFMCIGKPQFDSAMLISIAEDSVLTSGRGPLPLPTTFPQLQSSGHILIIPMYHAYDEAAHGKRTPADLQTEFAEMTRYRHALLQMLVAKNAANPDLPKLGAVCWEVNRTGIRHFHWQFVACEAGLIDRGLVEGAFKIKAEQLQYEKFQTCAPDELIASQRNDFFRVWIWSPTATTSSNSNTFTSNDNSTDPASESISAPDAAASISNGAPPPSSPPDGTVEKSMFFPISPSQRFGIQFGREVMAGLFGLEQRTNWKDVPAQEGDEAKDARAWKEDFGGFDFAMA